MGAIVVNWEVLREFRALRRRNNSIKSYFMKLAGSLNPIIIGYIKQTNPLN
jgi:hypothetical protein